MLELELPPEALARLWRAPALPGRRAGRARTMPVSLVWHDSADGALAADNLSLSCDTRGHAGWRLERLRPDAPLDWLPAQRAPLLAQAAAPEALGWRLPAQLAPVAAFEGRRRSVVLEAAGSPVQLSTTEGSLRGVVQDRTTCRLTLEGEWPAIEAVAGAVAASLPVSVPRAGLAAQALAVACGKPALPRRLGAPVVLPGTSLDDAIAGITAHLVDVILHWASLVPGCQAPEPVHQMRVGVRRLRSALSVFRAAAEGEEGAAWLDQLAGQLKSLAAQLGAARDWDVFLTETGAELGHAFAADRRVAGLMAAAARRRAVAYAELEELFQARAWPAFELRLATLPALRPWAAELPALRPWAAELPALRPWAAGNLPHQAALAEPARLYAERALDRRLKHVLARGGQLASSSEGELHELRKQAKKLRYATEFFARLFPEKPVRKYLPRLQKLQAVLGTVNDRAVAAALMDQLGGRADRAFACGVVLGFGAGRAAARVGRVKRAWARFARAAPFWD